MIAFNEHVFVFGGSNAAARIFGAPAAVGMFLFISGFSIASSLKDGSEGFYGRRFYRIYPVYFCATLLAYVPYIVTGGTWSVAPTPWEFVANFLLLPVPGLSDTLKSNIPTWTLGVECTFYLFAPFYTRLSGEKRLWVLYSATGLLAFGLLRHWNINGGGLGFGNYIRCLWIWLLGFEFFHRARDENFRLVVLGIGLSAGALTMIGGSWAPFTMAACFGLILQQDKIQLAPMWQRIALYFGELSYPIYIMHDPVMASLQAQFPDIHEAVYYPAVFAVAIITYHLIDRPMRERHRRQTASRKVQPAVLSTEAPAV